MAEGIPIEQANALTLKIQELEKKLQITESDLRRAKAGETARQLEVDQLHFAAEQVNEAYERIIEKLMQRLEDR